MATLTLRHPTSLNEESRKALELLAGRSWAQDTYLAGSAALALYLGHRPVRGLDLMTPVNRLNSPDRRDLLEDLLQVDPTARVETARNGYLFVRLASGVGVKLFYYPYPSIEPAQLLHEADPQVAELEVASALDLGLMKLGAIISRGTRRDFVDLYLLCRKLPLEELLARAPEKFGHVGDFPLQALKGLADRSLVDGEPMPRLTDPVPWSQVEDWLVESVQRLGRTYVGLEQ